MVGISSRQLIVVARLFLSESYESHHRYYGGYQDATDNGDYCG
jgi:hypothetical protein